MAHKYFMGIRIISEIIVNELELKFKDLKQN